jgi:hypothetical protein
MREKLKNGRARRRKHTHGYLADTIDQLRHFLPICMFRTDYDEMQRKSQLPPLNCPFFLGGTGLVLPEWSRGRVAAR